VFPGAGPSFSDVISTFLSSEGKILPLVEFSQAYLIEFAIKKFPTSFEFPKMAEGNSKARAQLYFAIGRIYSLLAYFPELEAQHIKQLRQLIDSLECVDAKKRNESADEVKKVKQLMKDFSQDESLAWKQMCNHFGRELQHSELFSLAQTIAELHGSELSAPGRLERRRRTMLIRWFDSNWEIIEPTLSRISWN
jgi:hypothetical protein